MGLAQGGAGRGGAGMSRGFDLQGLGRICDGWVEVMVGLEPTCPRTDTWYSHPPTGCPLLLPPSYLSLRPALPSSPPQAGQSKGPIALQIAISAWWSSCLCARCSWRR